MFFKKGRLRSDSWISSSASRGCRGKERGLVLQVLMAQVRKLRVRSFILATLQRGKLVGGGFEMCGLAIAGQSSLERQNLGAAAGWVG
jgi:hypothetical protein